MARVSEAGTAMVLPGAQGGSVAVAVAIIVGAVVVVVVVGVVNVDVVVVVVAVVVVAAAAAAAVGRRWSMEGGDAAGVVGGTEVGGEGVSGADGGGFVKGAMAVRVVSMGWSAVVVGQ